MVLDIEREYEIRCEDELLMILLMLDVSPRGVPNYIDTGVHFSTWHHLLSNLILWIRVVPGKV